MNDPSDDDYLPISALNDFFFCERRCSAASERAGLGRNQIRSKGPAVTSAFTLILPARNSVRRGGSCAACGLRLRGFGW